MGMNYNEFKKFADSHKELAKDLDTFIENFLMKQGMDCMAKTKKLTPVDTGRLRNAWKVSGPFKRKGVNYVVIHNNVKYASFIEDGHRIINKSGKVRVPVGKGKTKTVKGLPYVKWQKGHHMARISLTKVQNAMPQRFSKEFKKFCKDKGLG